MDLAEQIHVIERRHATLLSDGGRRDPSRRDNPDGDVLQTGWTEVDQSVGPLPSGMHEWFGVTDDSYRGDQPPIRRGAGARESGTRRSGTRKSGARGSDARQSWAPPMCLLAHLAGRVVRAEPRWIVWIGQRCFPYPAVLIGKDRDRALLDRSLFVRADGTDLRVWAMDVALRCRAVGAVIADGGGMSMAATRRIQLVAQAHRAWAMLARPPWERHELSAAQTRWFVRQALSENTAFVSPRWTLELLRCKGVHHIGPRRWALEWNVATSTLDLSTPLAHPAGDQATRQADGLPAGGQGGQPSARSASA